MDSGDEFEVFSDADGVGGGEVIDGCQRGVFADEQACGALVWGHFGEGVHELADLVEMGGSVPDGVVFGGGQGDGHEEGVVFLAGVLEAPLDFLEAGVSWL